MTAITATCPDCGSVTIPAADVKLNVSARHPDLSHYLFTCPDCRVQVKRPADEHIQHLLHGNGVVPKTPWEPPTHPEQHNGGPALTEDDLITFGLLLHGAVDILWWAR